MIFLSILTCLTSLMPLLIVGIKGVFYSIDPEVMYVGNALSFIKIGQIQYIDHPGTPSILLISLLLWPLRIYAKIIDRVPFIFWAFKHYAAVFLYLRVWQGLLFAISVWLFLRAVKSITGSSVMVMFSWLLLLIYPPFLRLGSGITPETLSFLFLAVWIGVLGRFLLTPDIGLVMIMGLTSGFAVANKFTNLFLVVASVLLPVTLKYLSRYQKLINSMIVSGTVLAGFVIGTWTIRDKYRILFGWVAKLMTSTGIHGGGANAIFDWSSYWSSVVALHNQLPWLYFGIALTLLTSFIQRKLSMLVVVFTIGVIAFAKYPLTYYQLSNYAILVFLLTFLLSEKSKTSVAVMCLFLLPLASSTVNDYLKTTSEAMTKTKALEIYVESHPSQKATLWEWGRAKDPALLLTTSQDWHGGIFEAEKRNLNLSIFDLYPISREKVFDLCWDQLYIQKVSIKEFTDRYPGKSFNNMAIPRSDDMVLLTSNHCLN